jgi:hypothetical protein
MNSFLPNSAIAELLALAAEKAKMPLQKALRRASRKAFLWPVEASLLVEDGRSLTELPGVGPRLNRVIQGWIKAPPTDLPKPPESRRSFITLTDQHVLAKRPYTNGCALRF